MIEKIKNWLFLDFETYYALGYTLRSMTIPEYLLDPRYETILCATAVNGAPSGIVDGPEFGEWLSQFDPETTATVTFNALFDNSILAWHYGFVPKLMLDSMNMARALRGHVLPKLNLEAVCAGVLGVTHDKSTIIKVVNMRRTDILAHGNGLWTEFCHYAKRDNERSRDIFKKLLPEFPQSEMRIMDLVIRAAVQPRFMVDMPLLKTHLSNVRKEKINLLIACGVDPRALGSPEAVKAEITRIGLMSTGGFKTALENLGVEIEYKGSPAGNIIPAFAKGDDFMTKLQEHADTRIQALACARLGVKSTLEETRTERLISIAGLAWDCYRDGTPRLYSGGQMPVPLRYAGAHTHRLSGDWRLNMQNMPRGAPGKPPMLRKALIAPPGHVVVAGDLAQIEARLVAWLAGAGALLAEFATKGGDPYSAFARIIFDNPSIDRKLVLPDGTKPYAVQGFIGKTGVLGLGYQCGTDTFYNMVAMLARLQGIDMEAAGMPWTRALALCVVRGYRRKYWQVPDLWFRLGTAVEQIWSQPGPAFMNVGPVTIRYGEIEGPNALKMQYGNPRLHGSGEWVFTYGFGTYKMYGGKMLENIIQFLARIIIMNTACRMANLGYNFALQAHDELAYIVPIQEEAHVKAILYRELTRAPSWGRDIPLEAEVKSGPSYGDCK